MNPLQKDSWIQIALIHEKHLSSALKKLAPSLPFTEEKIRHLTEEELL